MIIKKSIGRDEANEIIEEIINIMRIHEVTVETSKQLLQDTISSIQKETVIKQYVQAFHGWYEPDVHYRGKCDRLDA